MPVDVMLLGGIVILMPHANMGFFEPNLELTPRSEEFSQFIGGTTDALKVILAKFTVYLIKQLFNAIRLMARDDVFRTIVLTGIQDLLSQFYGDRNATNVVALGNKFIGYLNPNVPISAIATRNCEFAVTADQTALS